jgi:hypothetical protein
MIEELEGLGDLMKRSDEVEDGGKDVRNAQGDATNVDGPEASRKVVVVVRRNGAKTIDWIDVGRRR